MSNDKSIQKDVFNRAQLELIELRAKMDVWEKRPHWMFWLTLQSKTEALFRLRCAKKALEIKVDELRQKYFDLNNSYKNA